MNIRNSEGFTALNQAGTSYSHSNNAIYSFLKGVGATESGECSCENGVPFDQVACPISGDEYCESCDSVDLRKASDNALLECVDQRIQLGDNINEFINGSTHLHSAVLGRFNDVLGPRYESVVKLLVQNSADIDKLDSDGETPLHKAVKLQLVEIVRVLVLLGANVNLISGSGVTALKMAASHSARK